jgi:16S rRNA (guanine1207-N2)-methyltransferase
MFPDRFRFAQDELAPIFSDCKSVIVFNAHAPEHIQSLTHWDVTVVQGFAPAVHDLEQTGVKVIQDVEGTYDCAIVLLPKSKPLARDLIARAVQSTPSGHILVDGQKNDGVDSILKELKKRVDLGPIISKAHGKMAWFGAGGDLSDWRACPNEIGDGFETVAGVFSADSIDPASALLAVQIENKLRGSVADFGAGWGYLTRAILQNQAVTHIYAIEADHAALGSAQKNCADPRVSFIWDDATRWKAPKALDFVIMNPPFHHFGVADPKLGVAFISAAARNLSGAGQLLMVANRHLPYETALEQYFQSVKELDGTSKFKVFLAARPRKMKR